MQRARLAPLAAVALHRLLPALIAVSGLTAAAGVWAQDSGKRLTPQRTNLQWLQAMQNAAIRTNYSGTIVYEAGGEMRTSRITHLFDGAHSHERVQTMDGKPREFIRLRTESSDEVHCLIPESRRVVIEHRSVDGTFPGLSGASPEEILQRYDLRHGPGERVAGIECTALLLEPRDAMRYGYRLCVDPQTGLLLKSQTVNERREVMEQVAFTDVRIGEKPDRSRLKPAWPTDGWKVERSEYTPAQLERAGWVVPTPEGFRRIKEVQRKMGPANAMQVVFSDGLATVSVFIEPGAAGKSTAGELTMMGPTAALSRQVGDTLVTVIGEVPPAAVRAVARSVEYRGR
jgi:sigma-E factor negative regulatory protein RseB